MRTLLTIGILLVGLSGQALCMGHPHNVFAARKHMRAKPVSSAVKAKATACSPWQSVVLLDRNTFSKRLLTALSRVRPSKTY